MSSSSIENKYILYVRSDCPFCKKAVKLLEERNLDFNILDLKRRSRVLKELKNIYDWQTVPMVFCRSNTNIEFVGGFDDLSERLSDG
jgi:glutaredoxin 3